MQIDLLPVAQAAINDDPARVVYLVMAGGQGSRLWPLSHTERPKQFVDLLGQGASLLQMTVARLPSGTPMGRIFVNTAAEMVPHVREQLPQLPVQNWTSSGTVDAHLC